MSLTKQLWLAIGLVMAIAFGGSMLVSVLSARHYLQQQLQVKNIDNATSLALALSQLDKDYRVVTTDNRLVANGLLGLTYNFGDDSWLRWTNLYVHDTLKRTSLGGGVQNNQKPGTDYLDQGTSWYERELLTTQLYQVSASNPVLLLGTAFLLGLVALLACLMPARKATLVNPITALRTE